MPDIELASLLLVAVGLAVAVAFAVLAGKVTARVFFDASAAKEDEPLGGRRRLPGRGDRADDLRVPRI